MIDRSKLSPTGERAMVEIEERLIELCERLTADLRRLAEPSRREQRRARKAAKNRVMTKQFGWRPWRDPSLLRVIEPLNQPLHERLNGLNQVCNSTIYWHEDRMKYLRQKSSFVEMSRLADRIQRHQRLIEEAGGLIVRGFLFIPGDTGGRDAIGIHPDYCDAVGYFNEQMAELIKKVEP